MIRPQARYCCETCRQPIDHAHIKEPVEHGGVVLVRQTVRCNARAEHLIPSEVTILRALMLRRCRSTEALIMSLNTESETPDRLVAGYIGRIRRVLKAIGAPLGIRNIYGWGYELVPCRDA